MKCSYMSFLSTDSYLPGVLVLHYSLIRSGTRRPFLLLITPNVSASAREVLSRHGIEHRVLGTAIRTPTLDPEGHHWHYTYEKIQIFRQVEFDKIVFLDADMLINDNLDSLFDKPHMSAVNSGGLLPEHASWTHLNSGLLVIEPSVALFDDMIGKIESTRAGLVGGDQAFLQDYFSDWPNREELHLDHRYNMFHTHADRYHQLFGYGLEEIKVLHFIGKTKPWHTGQEEHPPVPLRFPFLRRAVAIGTNLIRDGVGSGALPLRDDAVRLWRSHHQQLMEARGAEASLPG
jgi:glycogenin